MSKIHEPKKVRVGENTFYIWPYPAFTAANITGDLTSLIVPMLAAVAPLIGGDKGILDVDITAATPAITNTFGGISGDQLESTLRKLLVDHQNITVDVEEAKGKIHTERLTEELAGELFCGEVQDMFILSFEVIRNNFAGFFSKLGSQSGGAAEILVQKMVQKATATSTAANGVS